MNTIDLKSIIEAKGLDMLTVATQLFPTNQYARLALNRVLAGKALLDSTQISKFALLANMTIDELYTNRGWKTESKNGIHKFSNNEYIAELDTNTWITKIFDNNSLKHESIIHAKDTPLSEYLEALNKVILNIKSNEHN